MNNHVKAGLVTMSAWILFCVVVCGLYLYSKGYSVDYFIDEETGGLISSAFFTGWAAIWYGIGYHFHKEYTLKKKTYEKMYGEGITDFSHKFDTLYFSDKAYMLAKVFFVFVFAFVAVHSDNLLTARNLIILGILMALSIVCYAYYKANNKTESF